MSNWKLYKPDGVQDILEEECLLKRKIEQKVIGVFRSYGYNEIQTPTFEFYDVFASVKGLINQETMLKFFDNKGRILTLRPDITTPIARIMATKYKEKTLPVRLCYVGNAFRAGEAYQGAKQQEFTQAGVELIGVNTAEADAEVISVTINALLAAGLEDFQIEIGQVDFFKGLAVQSGLNADEQELLRDMIDKKDSLAIEEYVSGRIKDESLKLLLKNLPNMYGDIEITDIDCKLNDVSKAALSNLKEVYSILKDYGLGRYISIDLGMVGSIDYYSGIVFKGFTHGMGFAICGGGRYDGLISTFGRSLPATGVAIGIDRLMQALYRNGEKPEKILPDALVYSDAKGRKTAYAVSSILRGQGLMIEGYVGGKTEEEAVSYAKEKGIGGIFICTGEDSIKVMDLVNNTIKTTTVTEIGKGI